MKARSACSHHNRIFILERKKEKIAFYCVVNLFQRKTTNEWAIANTVPVNIIMIMMSSIVQLNRITCETPKSKTVKCRAYINDSAQHTHTHRCLARHESSLLVKSQCKIWQFQVTRIAFALINTQCTVFDSDFIVIFAHSKHS